MEREYDLFISLKKKKQVNWWNRVGSRLVKAECYSNLLDQDDVTIGHFVWLKDGFFNKYVINKMNKLSYKR